jgi:hypothetical protein
MTHRARLVVRACLVIVVVVVVGVATSAGGCGEPEDPPPRPGQQANAGAGLRGVEIEGVLYALPPSWEPMRPTAQDTADGRTREFRMGEGPDGLRLVAYPGTAADLAGDARLLAWASEFEGPPRIGAAAERGKDVSFITRNCRMRVVEIAGTMRAAAAVPPGRRSAAATAPATLPADLSDQGMLVAVLQGGRTPVFLRVTGPRAAVAARREELMGFLTSASRVGVSPGP